MDKIMESREKVIRLFQYIAELNKMRSKNVTDFNASNSYEWKLFLSDIPVMENQLMYQAFSRFYGKGRKITVKVLFQRLKSLVRRLLGVDYR